MFKIETNKAKITFKFLFIKFSFDFFKLLSIFDFLIAKKKNKVCFYLPHSYINSCSVYLEFLMRNHSNKYEIVNIVSVKSDLSKFENAHYLYSFNGIYNALTSKYVIIPNYGELLDLFVSRKRHYLYFNHGMPIKTIGLTQKPGKNKVFMKKMHKRCNFLGKYGKFFVTSDIFKSLTISCFKANYSNVFITGISRNDCISNNESDDKLKNMFALEQYNKKVLYMPTYMKKENQKNTQSGRAFNNIFYFDDYDEKSFIKTLVNNHILFIMKPHPAEEFFYKQNPNVLPQSTNFKIVFNDDFYSNNIEHYGLFKFMDCMVSDYSSAPIDYLILNRPVVYLNSLANDYNATRGMILEDNYEILMPGVKVTTYTDFEKVLLDALTKDSYKQERERLLPLIHKYRDFNSCDRIYNIMKDLK